MCIAVPEELLWVKEAGSGLTGGVMHAGREMTIDLAMVPEVSKGDIVLVFRGSALRKVDAEEAERIRTALGSVADVMDGNYDAKSIEAGFEDLIANPGQLPEHLRRQLEK